jgi:glutathione S-transferase
MEDVAMLTLYQFPAPWDDCSASPFCAKLEGFMRWQDIPYQSVTVYNLKGSPKGKIPFIEDESGKLGDSNFIIEYLTKKHHLKPDGGLTAEQKAQARAFRYLCEESLYWVMVYFRWMDPQGWSVMEKTFFSKLSAPVKAIVTFVILRRVKTMLHMQGMGRHSRDEIAAIACADLRALSDYLGSKPYFFGDAMTTTDLVVFSVFANLTTGPFENPVFDYAKTLGNLMAHAQRIRASYFTHSPAKQAA